ncbi:hypothetical protein ARAF_3091 [Arsenophonus endosymbiont of Aleurodicus floccissimus]|nr:hypothetical protein ARAF_3091 [Arsenophonus endosymbiont of Aleurodicus floccissimus]
MIRIDLNPLKLSDERKNHERLVRPYRLEVKTFEKLKRILASNTK